MTIHLLQLEGQLRSEGQTEVGAMVSHPKSWVCPRRAKGPDLGELELD